MPEVAVDVWYNVGSRDEAPGRTGFAHLFEHMMFQGSKHVAEDKHFEYLQKAGASSVNGTTSHDRTNYFEVVPGEPARARAVARERPHGLPARPRRLQGDHRQPARRREERAPPALREPPHGPGLEGAARGAVPARPPLPPPGHRLDGGPDGRVGRRREGVLPHLLRRRTTPRWPSPATSIAPRPRQLVEQYFGPIPAGGPIPRRAAPDVRLAASKRIAMEAKVQQPQLYVDVSDAGELRARRSRAGRAGQRAGQRQVVAPVQAPGLRHEDRPVGERLPAEPAAAQQLRDHRRRRCPATRWTRCWR